mgnify:FL=1
MNIVWELFITFLKIGLLSIGGNHWLYILRSYRFIGFI